MPDELLDDLCKSGWHVVGRDGKMKTDRNMVKKVVLVLSLIALTFLVGWSVLYGYDKSAVVECEKLKRQSQEYPMFYLTPYEKSMCDHIGVEINAPVGRYHETSQDVAR